MRQAALTILVLTALLGCDKRTPTPQGSGNGPGPISPLQAPVVEGQETHGGDLAVAMLRSALMVTHHLSSQRAIVSKLMTMRATSESRGSDAPIYTEKDGLLEVNRDRVMHVDADTLADEVFGVVRPVEISISKARPPYVGEQMTPDRFKKIAHAEFANVATCMDNSYTSSFLVPSFDFASVSEVPVEYATGPIIDSVTKRRVDIGVTLETTPRILLDRGRTAGWSVTNYATTYLIFHEYAHLLMKAYGRDDKDHVLAATLFYTCSFNSERYLIQK